MRRLTLKMAIVCALAVAVTGFSGIDQVSASGAGVAQKGGDRGGGGGGNRGGGGGGNRGGGGGNPGGGVRAGGGFRGNGGIHAPAINAPRNAAGSIRGNVGSIIRGNTNNTNNAGRPRVQGSGNTNLQSRIQNHIPSLSHPNPGSIRSAITRSPAFNNRQNAGVTIDGRQNANNRSADIGTRNRVDVGRNGATVGNNVRGSRNSNSTLSRLGGITNRQYNGNALNFNNLRVPLANSRYRPAYFRHSNYYHGYWNANRGSSFTNGLAYGLGARLGYGLGPNSGYGWGLGSNYRYGRGYGGRYNRYAYRPLGWGLGGWGLGSLAYNSGYLGYSNPYYVSGSWSGYNYSQPIQVSYTGPVTVVDETSQSPDSSAPQETTLDEAVAAFRRNDYDAALDIVNKGIMQSPDDAVLHEFRALVLFARQDYQQAAATIHSVLAVGPGWDWTTMSGMYSNVDLYTNQLRALEAFTKSNPNDAPAAFLLSYHYLSCGHLDAAIRHLQKVVALKPDDRVAADILRMLEAPTEPTADSAENTPQSQLETEAPPVTPVDPQMLVGSWHASRPDGSKFTLTMTDDAKFTWSFAMKDQQPQEFDGNYTVEENVLALQREDGGSLVAEVTPDDKGNFNFRMLGAPEMDKGLDFSK